MRRLVDWFLGLPASVLVVIQVFAVILWHMPKMGDLSPYLIFVPGTLALAKGAWGLLFGTPERQGPSPFRFLNLIYPVEPKVEPEVVEPRQLPKGANPNAAYWQEPDPEPVKPLYEPMSFSVGRRPRGWKPGDVTETLPPRPRTRL